MLIAENGIHTKIPEFEQPPLETDQSKILPARVGDSENRRHINDVTFTFRYTTHSRIHTMSSAEACDDSGSDTRSSASRESIYVRVRHTMVVHWTQQIQKLTQHIDNLEAT